MVGTTPSPTPPSQGKASSGNPGPSPSQHHTDTTIPSLSPLVHFSYYTATSSCKFLETDLGDHKGLCHKRKKHSPTPTSPSGCPNPPVDSETVEKWSTNEEPHDDPRINPMAAKVIVAIDKSPGRYVHKRAKLASQPGSPGSPQIVHVSEDCFEDAVAFPLRRQYLTRSKAAANFG
ncbi:hypothetical protein D5086_027049 [Populus alba]|uniref:Uncharacterized protein n=1 Tax=Populus alba TaxID=43335 RepID=A0ACC4B466_POPAL